jgi:hypothetical protein
LRCASVAAVLAAESEKAAAHRLGLSHSTVKHCLANARSKVGAETTAQLVWIQAPRRPEPTPASDWLIHWIGELGVERRAADGDAGRHGENESAQVAIPSARTESLSLDKVKKSR